MNQNTFICNHRTKSNSSWGGGLVYAKDKTEAIMVGGNQTWYSMDSIIEHLGCSSLRIGGQEHYKANQFALKEKKTQKKIKEINTTLVSAAIHVCKMKAAGLAYERQVGFLSFAGVDVGNLGHGR